jgi:hypothetical protein
MSIVIVSNEGLNSNKVSSPDDYLLQSHESSSNPLTFTQFIPSHDSTTNLSSHAPSFNEHVKK